VPQERVGGDLQLERIPPLEPRRAANRSGEDLAVGLGLGESSKVVLADQQVGTVGKSL
jgi:hypothetical protein